MTEHTHNTIKYLVSDHISDNFIVVTFLVFIV